MTTIIRLEAENFKGLTAVTIEPSGSLIVVGGKNGAGKTSTLDAIEAALGGKKGLPRKPLREGAESGYVVAELEDITVKRTFSAKGSTLKVTSPEGATYASPQAMLDKLVGSLSFDPLAFMRKAPKEQAELLRKLVGLDFTKLDADRKAAFAERTGVNRELKQSQARLGAAAKHPDAPAEEVSVADLAADLESRQKVNRDNLRVRDELQLCKQDFSDVQNNVLGLQEELDKAKANLTRLQALKKTMAAKVDALTDEDIAGVREKMSTAEALNRQVRENASYAERRSEVRDLGKGADRLSKKLKDLDAKRAAMIAAADFPIEGLTVAEDGVDYDGLPLDQASGAMQLRVATAIGLAANPKLKVVLIRDGSLLDEDSLKLVAEMAADAGAQVWLERVGDGAEVGIVISDGAVIEDRTQQAARA